MRVGARKTTDLTQARSAKDKLRRAVARIPEVNGVGLTTTADGSYAIKVNLSAEPSARIPASMDGVPVVARVIGRIRKQGGQSG